MQTNSAIEGNFLHAGAAKSLPAKIQLWQDGSLDMTFMSDDERPTRRRFVSEDYDFSPTIPGLPVDIVFNSGDVFTPLDASYRWQSSRRKKQGFIAFLESNWLVVILAVVLSPLAIYGLITKGIPFVVDKAVVYIPQGVPAQMGKETLIILDKLTFKESELTDEQQADISAQWYATLAKLNLSSEKFKLHFRRSKQVGANAMALPSGDVIVTDDIVRLLEDTPNALLAVMLHEIGHVEHQHALKLIARSLSTSIVYAVFFGDIEGIGELVLGSSSTVLENSFSREMETDADNYSYTHLEKLGINPAVFADAMEALMLSRSQRELAPDSDEAIENNENNSPNQEQEIGQNDWIEYLSTHPLTQKRVEEARKRGQRFEELRGAR